MRKLVYIASPLSGDVETNLDFARQACLYAMAQGVTPFAPHLLYPQMLDDNDPAQRELGMKMGNQMLALCDELWLCGDITSPGVDIDLHRQKMGMVFQHFNLFPHMTVLENMTLAPVQLKKKSLQEAQAPAGEDGAVIPVGNLVPVGDLRGGEGDGLVKGILPHNQVVDDLGHVIAA